MKPAGSNAGRTGLRGAFSSPVFTQILLWGLAFLITAATSVYQRMVGPTRPERGVEIVEGEEIRYRLPRSMVGSGSFEVRILDPGGELHGELSFRRHPTDDPWTLVPLVRNGPRLAGAIPVQPPGGKVAYRFHLSRGSGDPVTDVPSGGPVVGRFRGSVPGAWLVPHVILMLLAMLWSNRAGLESLRRRGDPRRLSYWSFGLLVGGGLVFGPIVQWYAFGDLWTGFPLGTDLTDNKTLIAALAWLGAVIVSLRSGRQAATGLKAARAWALVAAVITVIIYSIPHSVAGTELDYSTLPDSSSVNPQSMCSASSTSASWSPVAGSTLTWLDLRPSRLAESSRMTKPSTSSECCFR